MRTLKIIRRDKWEDTTITAILNTELTDEKEIEELVNNTLAVECEVTAADIVRYYPYISVEDVTNAAVIGIFDSSMP